MVILTSLPGVSVTVRVGFQTMYEYPDPEVPDEETAVIRYIEAESGDYFAIDIEADDAAAFLGEALAFNVYLDGVWVKSPLLEKSNTLDGEAETVVEGACVPGNKIKKFYFSALETVSDGHKLKDEDAKVKKLGTIEVRVQHENLLHERGQQREFSDKLDTEGFVSEKALKGTALTHSTGLGEEMHRDNSPDWVTETLGDPYVPAGTYTTHYRSYESLKSMLIIPRTPSPTPFEDRDFNSLSLEELPEMHSKIKAGKGKEAAAQKIKPEREDDDIPRPRKAARPHAGSTILELNEDGDAREVSTGALPRPEEKEMIELD